tara:strand:+ start:136 stop:1236 length:1101 start_codon:yes stop_codon:yes gene_type:complete
MDNNPTVVPVDTVTNFTEKDLEWSLKLNDPNNNDFNNSKYIYPHLYGEELKGKRVDRRLVSVSDIDRTNKFIFQTQAARAVGNKKYKLVRQDINNFGFKLKHPPIALRQLKDGSLVHLNGRTRYQIVVENGFTNIIADIYTMTDDEASLFGLKANAENDPAGDLQIEDVYNECLIAVENKWIKPDLDQILERVNEACGSGKFATSKRQEVATRVYNNFSSTQKVLYWNSLASINNWMIANNYIETENIMYMVVSSSIDRKAVIMAAERYVEFGKQVRVVCHTGILNANDVEGCYNDRVEKFRQLFNSHVSDITNTYVEPKGKDCKVKRTDNIVLYGSLPAISTLHGEMNKIVKFKTSKTIDEFDEE